MNAFETNREIPALVEEVFDASRDGKRLARLTAEVTSGRED